MSATPPQMFDRRVLARRRKRARPDALFLHETARNEAEDRLAMVNRSFTQPAVVTPFPDVWRDLLPGAEFVADDDTLRLEPGAHDLVIHAMCLHQANDPVGQLIQCRRALRPDGLCLAILPGGRTLYELRGALGAAEAEVSGGMSPRVVPMPELREVGALLQRAGFALPVADAFDLVAEYRDLWHLMRDLRAMGEANPLTARLRTPTRRGLFTRADEIYGATHRNASGRLAATFELICLTGWAPDASQPQPLRPGSASARLADALGTPELKLPD